MACSLDEPWMQMVIDLLHSDLKCRRVLVRQVLRVNTSPPYYLIQVRGPGSQFCLNKGSAHKHNCVYFYFTPFYLI